MSFYLLNPVIPIPAFVAFFPLAFGNDPGIIIPQTKHSTKAFTCITGVDMILSEPLNPM
jgi:hypothetical protein